MALSETGEGSSTVETAHEDPGEHGTHETSSIFRFEQRFEEIDAHHFYDKVLNPVTLSQEANGEKKRLKEAFVKAMKSKSARKADAFVEKVIEHLNEQSLLIARSE